MFVENQVLRVLEGDMFMDSSVLSTPRHDTGNRSGRMRLLDRESYSGPLRNEEIEEYTGSLSLESLRTALWEREKIRTSSNH